MDNIQGIKDMEKIIEIDLFDKYDLTEKYNDKHLSSELLEYIIEQATFVTKRDTVKIVINKKCPMEQDCIKIITDGLKQEYNKSLKLYHITNIRQLFLLLLGIFFLFLSTLIKEDVIWKEVLLIGGWVPIWETIDIELFSDLEGRRKRIILKKLLKSEIIEK